MGHMGYMGHMGRDLGAEQGMFKYLLPSSWPHLLETHSGHETVNFRPRVTPMNPSVSRPRGHVAGSSPAHSQILRERSEEHTSELQSQSNLVCRLLLAKKN